MAIQQIQKSPAFKPEMVGDLVEVTVYDQSDGELQTIVGNLVAYSTAPEGVAFTIDGADSTQTVPAKGYTISVTHYEYILDLTGAEDSE